MTENGYIKKQISDNLQKVTYEINNAADKYGRNPDDITLMAVTKTMTAAQVNAAVDCGIRLLGENRAQELECRYNDYKLKKDSIHFIGHLQTNKLKGIIDKISMVQSLDSMRLLSALNMESQKTGITTNCLVQVNIADEPTKSGITVCGLEEFLKEASNYKAINIKGLMVIPPPQSAEKYFAKTQQLFVDIKSKNIDNINIDCISMGMSGDYQIAVKYGSNILRLGTAIFGARK